MVTGSWKEDWEKIKPIIEIPLAKDKPEEKKEA